jgi:ParB family chromosome partitioning protein
MDKFGTNVSIMDKGDKGRIEIEYVSQSDLTRILDLLEISLDD